MRNTDLKRRNHRRNSKRRSRIANKKRFTSFCVFCVMCVVFLFGALNSATATKHSDIFVMTVSAGDTLWEIASENNPQNMDVRDVIDDIVRLNRMTETNLHAGDKIIIPVY